MSGSGSSSQSKGLFSRGCNFWTCLRGLSRVHSFETTVTTLADRRELYYWIRESACTISLEPFLLMASICLSIVSISFWPKSPSQWEVDAVCVKVR